MEAVLSLVHETLSRLERETCTLHTQCTELAKVITEGGSRPPASFDAQLVQDLLVQAMVREHDKTGFGPGPYFVQAFIKVNAHHARHVRDLDSPDDTALLAKWIFQYLGHCTESDVTPWERVIILLRVGLPDGLEEFHDAAIANLAKTIRFSKSNETDRMRALTEFLTMGPAEDFRDHHPDLQEGYVQILQDILSAVMDALSFSVDVDTQNLFIEAWFGFVQSVNATSIVTYPDMPFMTLFVTAQCNAIRKQQQLTIPTSTLPAMQALEQTLQRTRVPSAAVPSAALMCDLANSYDFDSNIHQEAITILGALCHRRDMCDIIMESETLHAIDTLGHLLTRAVCVKHSMATRNMLCIFEHISLHGHELPLARWAPILVRAVVTFPDHDIIGHGVVFILGFVLSCTLLDTEPVQPILSILDAVVPPLLELTPVLVARWRPLHDARVLQLQGLLTDVCKLCAHVNHGFTRTVGRLLMDQVPCLADFHYGRPECTVFHCVALVDAMTLMTKHGPAQRLSNVKPLVAALCQYLVIFSGRTLVPNMADMQHDYLYGISEFVTAAIQAGFDMTFLAKTLVPYIEMILPLPDSCNGLICKCLAKLAFWIDSLDDHVLPYLTRALIEGYPTLEVREALEDVMQMHSQRVQAWTPAREAWCEMLVK